MKLLDAAAALVGKPKRVDAPVPAVETVVSDRDLALKAITEAQEIIDASPSGISEYGLIQRLEAAGYVLRIAAAAVDHLESSGQVRVIDRVSGALEKV